MKFEILNRELWPVAKETISFLKKKKFKKILKEKQLSPSYQFRPTIIGQKRGNTIVMEIAYKPTFQDYFEDFVKDCIRKREDVKIYMVFPQAVEDNEISYPHSFLAKVKEYGIGIIIVENKKVTIYKDAVKCHMRITRSELGTFTKHRHNIYTIVDKFNEGKFIDAIRDITELVEGEVRKLSLKAARKRKIAAGLREIKRKSFAELINILSLRQYRSRRQKQYFDINLRDDLLSYKGARNLSHHPRSKREEKKLEAQCVERLRMGCRLTQEVANIKA